MAIVAVDEESYRRIQQRLSDSGTTIALTNDKRRMLAVVGLSDELRREFIQAERARVEPDAQYGPGQTPRD